MKLTDISTPAVIINEDTAMANIAAYQSYCDEHGLAFRPHIKTHKLPRFAKAQLDAGAVGITCQKVSEAEIMADNGVRDIFITYNILGDSKLDRLLGLADRLESLRVVCDNPETVEGLSAAAHAAGKVIDVLVECDTGAGRCGVQSPSAAVDLTKMVVRLPGLRFAGLMTFPAVGGTASVQSFMTEAKGGLADAGIDCPIISSGGTPDMWRAHEAPIVTEYRIGTYIFNDRSLVERQVCDWSDCALTVLTTIVSTPTPERAIADAGSKVLTSDLFGLDGYGHVLGRPELTISALSEEHGTIHAKPSQSTGLKVGDRIQIVPNHCCVVANMLDSVYLYTDDNDAEPTEIAARGCVT